MTNVSLRNAFCTSSSAFGTTTRAPTLLLLFTAFIVSACEPISMLPGGALSGSVATPPEDWSSIAAAEVIQLETRPADPYSINIWGAGVDADLYVATGEDGTTWTAYIANDPRVRVRIGEQVFELTASTVEDTAERSRVARAYIEKYELDPEDNWVDSAMVFRLDRL